MPVAPVERQARRLSPLTPVVRSFIVLVAAAMTVLRDVTRGDLGPTALLFLLLLIGGGIYGTASWLRTTFWIESDELRVDTGVISRQSRRIRIDRLQGIDIVQPFVGRLFGLAELRMDVAGGGSREGSLAYLPVGEARRLKDLLLARRDQIGAAPGATAQPAAPAVPSAAGHPEQAGVTAGVVTGATAGATVGAPGAGVAPAPGEAPPLTGGVPHALVPPAPTPDRLLAAVDLRTLLLSILLSGETVVLVLGALGILGLFAATGQWVGASFSAMLPLLLGVGLAQFRKLSANYRFTVSETAAGLQVRRGMFDLSSQTIALNRVQGVVVTEPLLWRALGWARLDVSIAGYSTGAGDDGPAASTVLPVGDRRTVMWLARYVLRDLDLEQVPLRPVPARARWVAPVSRGFLRVGTDHHLVVSRGGWFGRRTHVAPQARIQSLRITQGPWQRRLGLADVHVDSPPGPTTVRARHRDAGEARRLFDVEVAMSAWARGRLSAGER